MGNKDSLEKMANIFPFLLLSLLFSGNTLSHHNGSHFVQLVIFSTLQSLYKAISGHSQPEGYKQPAVLSDGQVWIPLGRAVFLEADFRTSEVGDTAMNVFKVLVLQKQFPCSGVSNIKWRQKVSNDVGCTSGHIKASTGPSWRGPCTARVVKPKSATSFLSYASTST